MKKSFYQIFSYGCIAAFLIYWLMVILLSMPSNNLKQQIFNQFPRFRYTFSSTWNLFSPPYLNHKRLYYILKDSHHPERTDTIEVLEKLWLQKQKAAPFNQKENIIDHNLFYNVAGLTFALWRNDKKPSGDAFNRLEDSLLIANAISAAENNPQYLRCLGSLQNYCIRVLKENRIDSAGKLVKILIIEKQIKPLKEIKNPGWLPKQTIVFESGFYPI